MRLLIVIKNTMDFVKEFSAGWLGGVAGMLVGHPFDTVKARLQTQGTGGRVIRYRGTFHCFSDIVKTEGVRALYKGLASPLLGMAGVNAIVFSVYGGSIRYLQPQGGDHTFRNNLMAGAMAGTVQSSLIIPIELIKLRMQLQNIGHVANHGGLFHHKPHPSYIGPVDTAINIFRTKGLRGLYQGSTVTLCREAPAFAMYFSAYDWLRHAQVSKGGTLDDLTAVSLILAGGVSGVLAWVVTYPFDVVKSRLQVDGMGGAKRQYTGMLNCFAKSYREEGVRTFFRGLNATLLRAFPVNAATFVTVTLTLRRLRATDAGNT